MDVAECVRTGVYDIRLDPENAPCERAGNQHGREMHEASSSRSKDSSFRSHPRGIATSSECISS